MQGNADGLTRLAQAGYVEFRSYRVHFPAGVQRLEVTLQRHGIRPILTGEKGAFLFAFDTLATREKAWRELNSRREWLELGSKLEDLAIYKNP